MHTPEKVDSIKRGLLRGVKGFLTNLDDTLQAPPSELLKSVLSTPMTRREFDGGAARLGAGLVMAANAPELWLLGGQRREVLDQEWIYTNVPVWQTNQWFPYTEEVAAQFGIRTIYRSLRLYSMIHRTTFPGQDIDLEKDLRQYVYGVDEKDPNAYVKRYSGTLGWSGGCPAVATINMVGPQPKRGEEPYVLADGSQVVVDYIDRMGIWATYRTDDIGYRPFVIDKNASEQEKDKALQKNLDFFAENLINADNDPDKGQPFIISALVELGKKAFWDRVVVGVSPDGQQFLCTDFDAANERLVVIPRENIIAVYYPISWPEAEAQNLDPRLFAEIPERFRFHQWMDGDLVNGITF